LGTETDALEESNAEVINQIQTIVQRDRISEQDRDNMQREMEEASERLANEIETHQNETEQTKKMFKKIQDPVDQMVAMFKRSKFSLAVAT